MTIGPEDVRRVAALAQLDVTDAELPSLTAQLDAIVAYVGHLGDGRAGATPDAEVAPSVLRPDVVSPTPLDRPLDTFAPEMQDGFFLVPRLTSMDGP